ncbi:MAG: hypothetical protein NC398_06950 [Acetatifactor muris]|nr:hypothetical protein [Acetatifactor muris]MCM1525674.1 hypothetical protein [Bacteroides sp.]
MQILKKVFKLPPLPTLLIAVPSFALVIYVLVNEIENEAVSYAAYILSAYALVITVTGIVDIVRWIRHGLGSHPMVKKARNIPVLERYLKEASFRTEISLYQGLFINLLYVAIKFFSGVYYRSFWFGALAVYYLLLALMRFALLHHVRRQKENKIAEWRRYRLCGIMLLFMNQALVAIVVSAIRQEGGFEYAGMLIYVMALYAFYTIITAVINVFKFRKYGSPVLSAAKVINLTAALVSMFALEIAMLTQFGGDETEFRHIMTSATGAGVCVIVLGLAIYMIVRSTKALREIGRSMKSSERR